MKKFTVLAATTVLLGITLLVIRPLFHPGFFPLHDPTWVLRLATLRETLAAGQVPAAWHNSLNHGYGFPLALYYAPLFGYLGALLSLFTPSYLFALKLALGGSVFLAGLGMYYLLKAQGRLAGILSAIAYTLLPYHATTLYVRGSYAEMITWTLLPWVLYAWTRPLSRRGIVLAACLTAGFLLSHNSLPFLFLPFILLWITLLKPRPRAPMLLTLFLSVGLTAWFLLPVIFEQSFVQAQMIAARTDFRAHFLLPLQLWHSPWGYGGSAALTETDGMSFMLGKFQLILSGIALISAGLARRWDRRLSFYLLITLFFAYMTTVLSTVFWELIPTLAIVQFPWRLLSFAGFGISALIGYTFSLLPARSLRVLALPVLVLLLLWFNLKFFVPETYLDMTDANLLSSNARALTVDDKIPEYLPVWMKSFPSTAPADGLTRSPIAVVGTTKLLSSSPLSLDTAYMPHWRLTLNGHPTQIEPDESGAIVTSSSLDPGDYMVDLSWHRTPLETFGLVISLLSLIVVIGLAI